MPEVCANALVGDQRAAIHRACEPGGTASCKRFACQCRCPRQSNPVLLARRLNMAVAIEIERNAVERAYDRWAPVYDLVFGPVFERGRRASRQAAERIGGRILEVGVGTGLSLPDYSRRNRIVRVTEIGLSHVEALEVMDAERLNFPDDSFDVVVAQYVVTAVPNPEAALDEFARVLKPGGEIILLSRVGAETGPRKAVEHF